MTASHDSAQAGSSGGAPRSTRDLLLDAAHDAAVSGAWARTRMADVAAAAGVSRQTLYNAFGTKDALADALASREAARFVEGAVGVLGTTGRDPGEAAGAAVAWALDEAARSPLVRAALLEGSPALLPQLTTRSGALVSALRDGVCTALLSRWPSLDGGDTRWVAEVVVRLAVSHVLVPTEAADETAAHVTTFVRRLLTPSGGTSS